MGGVSRVWIRCVGYGWDEWDMDKVYGVWVELVEYG